MAEIINDGSTLKVIDGSRTITIPKNLARPNSFDDIFRITYGNEKVEWNPFSLVTVPSRISADDLRSKIEAFLDSSVVFTETQLTEAGATEERDASAFNKGTFSYVIANIDTNVVMRFEASEDGVDYYNLDVNDVDITHESNGTFAAIFKGRHNNVRARLVSESGGTNVTVDVKLRLGN